MKPLQPFVNRRQQLQDLERFLRNPPAGPAKHIAIIAGRRIGKSELIKEFRRRHRAAFLPVLEVQTADLTAGRFVRELLLAYLIALLRPKAVPLATSVNIIALAGGLRDTLRGKIADILAAADGGSLPDHELRGAALKFGEELLTSVRSNGILFLDECEDWFAPPGEDPTEMEKVLAGVVNTSERQRLVITGSAQRVLEATFRETPRVRGRRRPLLGRFQTLLLGEFTDRDTKELAEKLWKGHSFGAEATSRVFTLTRGHPGAAVAIAEAARAAALAAQSSVTPDLVQRAFVDSLFEPLGLLNALAEADYSAAVSVGRSPKTMARVLDTVADLGPARATGTEISRVASVKQPNVKEMLTPLLHTDLLRFDEASKTYSFSNALLPMWLRGRNAWVHSGGAGQPYAATTQIVLEELERYRTEVAVGAEAVARDTASQFDGGSLPGALFGRPGTTVTVPHVTKPVRELETVDRNGLVFRKNESVQIDLYVDAREEWVGEVKTKGRVTAKMLERLKNKADLVRRMKLAAPKVLWSISSAGFDQKALDYAKQHGLLISRSSDLRRMRELLRQPPSSPARRRP